MAEINVQRKGPGAWPWIIGVFALMLVGWAVIAMMDRDRDDPEMAATGRPTPPSEPTPAATTGDAPAAAVAAFLTFADAPTGSQVSVGHEYAADGIRRLTAALKAVVENGPDRPRVRERFAEFQQKADRIQRDPQSLAHAGQVRDVFTSAAEAISALQEDRWPDASDLQNQIAQVRTAAGRVDADRPLLDQTSAVKTFFDRAAVVVRAMADRR
jgi:hypothetical protein